MKCDRKFEFVLYFDFEFYDIDIVLVVCCFYFFMWVYCLYDFDVCEDGSLKKLYIYFLGKFDDVCVFEVVCCDFCFFIFFILNVKSWKVVCWYFIYLDLFIKY